jgi:16S rRNA (guanine527-N7)-methyltransferase
LSTDEMRAARLRADAAALGLDLREAAVGRLLGFVELLQRWNATYNLTAVRDPEAMLAQHLVDCLAAVAGLQRRLGPQGRRVLDVGSGGGLPGVVIAIVREADRVVCVDAVGKKAAFVRQAAAELRLSNLAAEHVRVEALRAPAFEVVTSRAFASLVDFVNLTHQHLADSGVWMAMKGKRPDEEIRALPDWVDVFHVEHLVVPGLAAERCLVWMRRRPPC